MYTIEEYTTENGASPFRDALEKFRDTRAQVKIHAAIAKMENENLGDHKSVGAGVIETRIDYAKGYRIYYGRDGKSLIILLMTGHKGTQTKDADLAKEYWRDYKKRKP